jgi:hypothetical protein
MCVVKDAGHIQALFDRPALEKGLAFADKYLKGTGTKLVQNGAEDLAHPDLESGSRAPVSSETAGGM